MFVIKVNKRNPNEKTTFEDVQKEAEVFHAECYNGSVTWKRLGTGAGWRLTCSRCKASTEIGIVYSFTGAKYDLEQETRLAIVQTAFDGRKRKIKSAHRNVKILVVQKEQPK